MIDSFIDLAKSPMTQFTDYLIPVSNGIPNFDESVPTFISKIFFVCDRSSSLIIHWILFHLFFLKISFGFVKEITFVIGLLSRFACKVMGLSYNILDGLFILFLWVFALGFRIVFPTYSSCSNLIFLDWFAALCAWFFLNNIINSINFDSIGASFVRFLQSHVLCREDRFVIMPVGRICLWSYIFLTKDWYFVSDPEPVGGSRCLSQNHHFVGMNSLWELAMGREIGISHILKHLQKYIYC